MTYHGEVLRHNGTTLAAINGTETDEVRLHLQFPDPGCLAVFTAQFAPAGAREIARHLIAAAEAIEARRPPS